MSVTYGFYNSDKGDRKYNAVQMSSIFDGIIRDGIFMSIGTCFVVTTEGKDMTVMVGIGRAWFDHTWTLNDAILPLVVPQAEVIMNRIDAVVLEVNAERNVRANSIKIITGTPSSNPTRPSMTKTKNVHQYPLCYISVAKGVTSIRQADITNMVGSGDAPYVTGILNTINIESMVLQWEDQWKIWLQNRDVDFAKKLSDWQKELDLKDEEFAQYIADWEQTLENKEATFDQFLEDWQTRLSTKEAAFDRKVEDWEKTLADKNTEFNTYVEDWEKTLSDKEAAFDVTISEFDQTIADKEAEFDLKITEWTNELDEWIKAEAAKILKMETDWEVAWREWFVQYTNSNQEAFETWLNNLKAMLDDVDAAKIAADILDLKDRTTELEKSVSDDVSNLELLRNGLLTTHSIYSDLSDSTGSPLSDSNDQPIEAPSVVFATMGDLKKIDNTSLNLLLDGEIKKNREELVKHSTSIQELQDKALELEFDISETNDMVSALIDILPVKITQTEYDALTTEEKNNGRLYIIISS